MGDALPKFSKPPVIETVLGIAFKPIMAFQIPHFGLFWDRIRTDYKKFSVLPPLPEEQLPNGRIAGGITFNLLTVPQFRCWFFNDEQGWLLQVQNSRFVSNWRKTPDGPYPTFSRFEKRFEKDWDRFQTFLKEMEMEAPMPNVAEVSYINHIDIDSQYNTLSDVFLMLSGRNTEFLPAPAAVSLNTIYPINDDGGILQISSEPVVRRSDAKEVLQLTVTAKTRIASNDKDSVLKALGLGHEWVVRGFTDFTTDEMHKKWGRTQ
jgi:uncharacterized protein (TIGR04255 family)